MKKQKEILKKYVEGEFDSSIPIRVYEYNWQDSVEIDKYYLLKTDKFIERKDRNFNIRNMICLSKSLYYLSLLENGKFQLLSGKNIDKQLKLFDIEYIESIRIDYISDLISVELLSDNMDSIMDKVESGSKILRKIKTNR